MTHFNEWDVLAKIQRMGDNMEGSGQCRVIINYAALAIKTMRLNGSKNIRLFKDKLGPFSSEVEIRLITVDPKSSVFCGNELR